MRIANRVQSIWNARLVPLMVREPLQNSARARRGLCGRHRPGLGKCGLVIPNERAHTGRSPRQGLSRMDFAGKDAAHARHPEAVATATVTRAAVHNLRLFRTIRAPRRVLQRFLSLAGCVAALLWVGSVAAQTGAPATRIKPPVPDAPQLLANSYLLQDFNSGKLLVEHNANERVEPASITKVMTAYVVFHELRSGKLKLDDQVDISEKAWRKGGSKMFIEVGDQVAVEDLLRGMVVQSGNDASIALAEAVAGSETAFASVMNGYAAQLGMRDTHFTNATGWPDEAHFTTAADLARLARAMILEFPDYYEYFAEQQFTYGGISQPNRNRLLYVGQGVDGLKTGHTESAGYCLLASAVQDDTRLISVVMGTESEQQRNEQSLELLVYGQRFYSSELVQKGATPLGRMRVWKGAEDSVSVQVEHDIYAAVPRGRVDEIRTLVRVQEPLLAPIEMGQQLGTMQVLLGDEVLLEQPLLAAAAVPQAGIMTRWWHGLRLWMGAGAADQE